MLLDTLRPDKTKVRLRAVKVKDMRGPGKNRGTVTNFCGNVHDHKTGLDKNIGLSPIT